MGLLLALMMVFSLCANSFTAYAWNLSDIEEMPMEDPNAIADEPVVDEPKPIVEDDYLIEEADEPTMTIEEDDQRDDLEDGLEISDEEVSEPVAVPDGFDLSTINTIAKDKDGNYYGARTYGNSFDTGSEKVFYSLTKDQYDQVANNSFMVFKEKNGTSFEIPRAKIGTNDITESQPIGTDAGPIFTELQFRHHMAYRFTFFSLGDPTIEVASQKDWTWSIELKKDWIIEPYAGFGDNSRPDYAYIHFNVDLDGKGHTIKRNDANDWGIFQIGPAHSGAAGSYKTVTIKNLNIDGGGNYYGILLRHTTTLNLENTHISNCKVNLSSFGGGITLFDDTVLNMDAASSIIGCKANRGGAIKLSDKVTLNINGSTLSNNTADLGGAICSLKKNNTINVNGATFDGNKAVETIDGKYLYGGAIYSQSNLSVEDSKFTNNSADGNGGAIYSYKAYTINGSKFNKNTSKNSGGAIYNHKDASVNITKAIFNENEAKWGGAIANYAKSNIKKSNFDKNVATYNGGAIYTGEGITIEESNFTENQTLQGGGIYIDKNATNSTKVSNTSFEKNSVDYGGAGIFVDKNSKLEVTNSTFTKNEGARGAGISSAADGSVDINLTNIKVDESTFTENEALQGGGIFTAFPTEINNSTFKKNQALIAEDDDKTNPHDSGVGGAVRVMDNKTTIKGSTFEENSAFGSGGAIGINGVARDKVKNITTIKPNIKVEISDNTQFIANICGVGQGGAIFTIPYLYDIEGYETGVDKDTLKAEAYKNLSTSADTIFKDNLAISGFVDPPANYTKYTNLAFARNSFTEKLPNQPVAKSLLNNYDVNYKNEKLSAFFDPNGGEFKDGANPKDIRVVNGEANKEITLLEAPKWEGHKFIGWKCSMNISKDLLSKLPQDLLDELKKLKEGKIYQAGDKFTLDADYIFVAQWDKADTPAPRPSTTVILTLDENHRGGEITNIEVEEGDLIEPHLYIPRRRGYIFRGWSYDRKHLDEVKPGDRIYTNTTLYAIWKRAEEEVVEEPIEIKGEDHKTYIFGYPDGTVRPNGSITRAEAAAMLSRLLNIEAIGSASKPQFTDTESSWYNKAINAVVFRGIMKGYPDGRFRPNAPITRAEFTQMISTIDNKPYGVAPFADVQGHWAERAIGSEYQAKRITGYPDGLFRPDANITRAEAAVILNKIFERKYDNLSLLKCKNPQMIKRFTDLDESFWGWNDMVEATNSHEYVRRYKEDVLKRLEEDWLLIK